MKQTSFLAAILIAVVTISSCGDSKTPGKIYMPDMSYSRALETYVSLDTTVFTTDPSKRGREIFYNAKPVDGTMRIGDLPEYPLANDTPGYIMSATIKNPLEPMTRKDSLETARLFNINCAVCHGAEGKANGPIADKIGAVANLTGDAYIKMADGTMYHSINYGKNNMGSYASQLSRRQRWQIVQYIRTLQPKPAAKTDSTGAAGATSAKMTVDTTKKM